MAVNESVIGKQGFLTVTIGTVVRKANVDGVYRNSGTLIHNCAFSTCSFRECIFVIINS